MWLEDHFGSGSVLQRNERVKLAASFWNNIGAGFLDQNRYCDSGTCAWLGLLLNRQQHFNLYAHSARTAALGKRRVQIALGAQAAENRGWVGWQLPKVSAGRFMRPAL